EGGDEDRAVDADLVHRRHHLVTRHVIGPVRHRVPGSLWGVRLIGVDLGIDDRHRESSSVARKRLVQVAPAYISFNHVRLAYLSLPTMMWSCTEISSGFVTSTTTFAPASVSARPSLLIVPTPQLQWPRDLLFQPFDDLGFD